MSYTVRRVEYFHTTVENDPQGAYQLLATLAGLGISLLAFTAVPTGPVHIQLTLFPDDPEVMRSAAQKAGAALDGPYAALLVRGDDELGALARVHERLNKANVSVFASTGLADGQGSYGYVIYVRPADFAQAAAVFEA